MSKKLIIAEKPSVAGDIARALGGFTRKGEYFESDDYVLSSAVGHLLELTLPPEHDVKKGKWSFAKLPVIPPHFDLAPIERSEARLNVLLKLLKRKDVGAIINACDAGREGELIFRYIAQYAKTKKPIERLWLQSMTQGAIREGFETLRRDRDLLPLADAAKSRSEADWLVGINGTRAMTAFNSKEGGFYLTTVGRVQTPTLAILVEREEKIRVFQPRDYWEVHARFAAKAGEYAGRWFDPEFKKDEDPERKAERLWKGAQAEAVAAACAGKTGTASEETKPTTQASPLLYDLTSLQRDANGRFGFSAKGTLSIAQALYERHKALTYPRTDARALPEDYLATVKKTMDALTDVKEFAPFAKQVLKSGWVKPNKRIFDNSKISDHFAIIPTPQTPGHLSEPEAKLYDLVVRRFLAVFFPSAEFLQTTRITVVGEERFKTEGKVLQSPGWLAIYGKSVQEESENLPAIVQGEKVATLEAKAIANQTRPPARFSEATLLSAMEGAGKLVEDDELRAAMGAKGLGTPATRAAVIEGLDQREVRRAAGPRIEADVESVPAAFCAKALRGRRDHLARAHRRLGVQAQADGAGQAAARAVHGPYPEGNARSGEARQGRQHPGRGVRDRAGALPQMRRRDPGDLPQIPVSELRLLRLAGAAWPRLGARRSRRTDHQEVHRPAQRVSQQAGPAFLRRTQAHGGIQDRVRLRPGR
jgi:DNA topoisomerase-3